MNRRNQSSSFSESGVAVGVGAGVAVGDASVTVSLNSAVLPLLVALMVYSPTPEAVNCTVLPVADQSGFCGQDQVISPT